MGLSKDSKESLNAASRGAFLHLSASTARAMLDRISGKTPCTIIHYELQEEKESSLKQEEEVLIAKSQQLRSQDLAINREPPIPQNPPKEEGIPPSKNSIEIKDDLFGSNFGRALNSHKRPSSEYNSNLLKKGSLRKRRYSHLGH